MVLFGWIVCFGILLSTVYGIYSDKDNSHIFNVGEYTAYHALHRTGWGVAVCWIVFACATGYGGRFTKVVCFSRLLKCLRSLYGKQCRPDQTAPIGAVCSGSTLFASILNSSVMLGNYLQQTTSADVIFRCIFVSKTPSEMYMRKYLHFYCESVNEPLHLRLYS